MSFNDFLLADQDLNVKQAENSGYAKFVEILDITEEKLEKAITELVNNPMYVSYKIERSIYFNVM